MILASWFWHRFGDRVIPAGFNPDHVNSSTYDLTLGEEIKLQVYRGVEYPNTPAILTDDGDEGITGLLYECPYTRKVVRSYDPFAPGDRFLGVSQEYVRLPRYIRALGRCKSSTVRAGADHGDALYIDPGFSGDITFEILAQRTGWFTPGRPIVQLELQLVWGAEPYGKMGKSHYHEQRGVTANRNRVPVFSAAVDLYGVDRHMYIEFDSKPYLQLPDGALKALP